MLLEDASNEIVEVQPAHHEGERAALQAGHVEEVLQEGHQAPARLGDGPEGFAALLLAHAIALLHEHLGEPDAARHGVAELMGDHRQELTLSDFVETCRVRLVGLPDHATRVAVVACAHCREHPSRREDVRPP